MWLIVVLMAWPLIEIGLYVEIGGRLGLWPTLGFVIGSAALGVLVLRAGGVRAQNGLRAAMSGLQDPAVPLATDALILLAGGLLILPGFLTDFFGLLLLLPPVRSLFAARMSARVAVQTVRMGPQRPPQGPQDGRVIDGEFLEIDPKNPPNRGDSGWTRH